MIGGLQFVIWTMCKGFANRKPVFSIRSSSEPGGRHGPKSPTWHKRDKDQAGPSVTAGRWRVRFRVEETTILSVGASKHKIPT